MRTRCCLALGMVWLWAAAVCAQFAVVNDGTTTANLTQLSNEYGTGGAEPTLTPSSGILLADQPSEASDMAARTVWYLNSQAPTSGVYSVAADFKPATAPGVAESFHRGGVMGWLNVNTNKGIGFHVVPGSSFQVATVDFLASVDWDNESANNLYNLDGTPASAEPGSTLSDLSNYDSTQVATFQLDFAAPSEADLAALSNATARVTARVFQGGGATANQVGQTIALLTDLPAPGPGGADQRVGYYAYWASLFRAGTIGELDNLRVSAGFAPVANLSPQVVLASPPNGATFTAPAQLTLTADASDQDDAVARVEFFANGNPVGSDVDAPYSVNWSNVSAGSYSLTAVATDLRGAATTSANEVKITVNVPSGDLPRLSIVRNGDNVEITWPAEFEGFRLQSNEALRDTGWVDYENVTGNSALVLINDTQLFFRLVK